MFPRNFKALALGMALSVSMAGGVMAQQTAPGTEIKNTITLNYNTGAGANIDLVDPPEVMFLVDRKVDLILSTMTADAETTVVPGTTNAVLVFKLENKGNGTQGFVLDVDQAGTLGLTAATEATTTPDPNRYWLAYGTTDVFGDAAAISIFDPASATSGLITDLNSDTEGFIFIVANVEATKLNGLQDTFTLTATATTEGGTMPVQESRSADREIENVVLADDVSAVTLADGTPALTNVALDGKDADQGRFRITAPVLTATKTVSVLDENMPGSNYNCSAGTGTAVVNSAEPAYLPGGCIAYTITVFNAENAGAAGNAGAVAATTISIRDELPTGISYAGNTPGSFTVIEEDGIVTATLATLAAGASASFIIRAEVD